MTGAGDFFLRDVAEGAVLVEYAGPSDEDANRRAVSRARSLAERWPAGLLAAVPGARTLLVEFDPRRLSRGRLARVLRSDAGAADTSTGRALRIPVFYGADPAIGPDLPELAREAGLSAEEFSRRHSGADYRVAFLGFAPGFAYLRGLPGELHAARLSTPRTRVPAGSVGIGGSLTGIYPGETPGGWRLIGRAPVRLFEASRDPPALLLPGDTVRFEPITREDFESRRAILETSRKTMSSPGSGSPLFRVIAPGALTSVQGVPRRGWEIYGVPPGGAMDLQSLAFGNALLGNPVRAAALEMTLVGPELEVLAEAAILLTAAALEASLNGRPVAAGQPLRVRAGDHLSIGPLRGAARGYLCVAGGLARPDRPGPPQRLASGDTVFADSRRRAGLPARAAGPDPLVSGRERTIRVLPGPQRERFEPEGIATFLNGVYRVSSSSDRRGIRLEGPPVENRGASDIPPEGTTLGGIQVPKDGKPIILGPDRPVTGGYARIATVIAADFRLVAQAPPGAPLRFVQVTLAEALAASSPSPESRIPRAGSRITRHGRGLERRRG